MSQEKIVISDVMVEYDRAVSNYGSFQSPHEGYAIILEELDELKAEVWKKPSVRSSEKMREEAIQVAAMAIRFIIDVCDKK
ncbi:MAG: hypothetical protein ABFD07_04230 [Methanobacterium sp.]